MIVINRLHLDFSLGTATARAEFAQRYLDSLNFKPTPEELETIANYMLYGVGVDGKNSVQNGEVEIKTKHSTWDKDTNESLDGLREQENFNELTLHPLSPGDCTRVRKRTFSRNEALKACDTIAHGDVLRAQFESLWTQIDELELELCYYDMRSHKREKPPREELLSKFDDGQLAQVYGRALKLTPYTYLKKRHLLVELRREQFTLADFYLEPPQYRRQQPLAQPALDDSLGVAPVGLLGDFVDFFCDFDTLCDPHKNGPLRGFARSFEFPDEAQPIFNFANEDHLAHLCAARDRDLPDDYLATFNYYVGQADLDDCARDILDLKRRHLQNPEIADQINAKWNKSYNINYISTIYRKRILAAIADAARWHKMIIANLSSSKNFKQCSECGRWYLRSPEFFVRKTKAVDGLTNRCKRCDRERRANR